MSADETQQLPVQQVTTGSDQGVSGSISPASTPEPSSSDDELRVLARKAVGLVVGLVMLIGCGFAVSHLNAWGDRWTMPLVFVIFVLVMMLASNLVVGGASAVWNAARTGAR